MKKNNKRAQFFLMAGIIIILVLYTLTINYNWVKETIDLQQLSNFEEKSESYNKESAKVINYKIYTAPADCLNTDYAITHSECPPGALADFSSDFVKYAKQSDPNYGLVFVYKMPDGSIIVKNMLGGWLGLQEGQVQTLKFSATDNQGNPIKIDGDVLLSTQDKSTGSIDLNIGGQQFSTSVQTDTSNFGQGLSQAVIKDADKIILKIGTDTILIPLKDDAGNPKTLQSLQMETFDSNNAHVSVS